MDPVALTELDAYLHSKEVTDLTKHGFTMFAAEGKKHADAIELCSRDTSTWCCSFPLSP